MLAWDDRPVAPTVVSLADRPDLDRPLDLERVWPEFMKHGDVTNLYWDRLYDELPEFQLVLVDDEDGEVLGRGNTIPFQWDGSVSGLPAGVDGVLERAFEAGGTANTLSALVAIVSPEHQGRGLSAVVIEGMRAAAARHGLGSLVAPVRPTRKELYPLIPLERYAVWRRADGLPFDPWIRLHERIGGEILGVASNSLVVTGPVAEWEEWAGMAFPETGDYVVPGALVPVHIDREADEGRYVEPNLWMRHAVEHHEASPL
jgi:GNAT superfamily N-acetyltransferase